MTYEPTELSAYLDGELTAKERRSVEARLASDPAYTRELAHLERTRTMLALCLETPAFHDRIMMRVRCEEMKNSKNTRLRLATWLAAAAVLAISVASVYVLVKRPPQDGEHAIPAVTTTEGRPAAQGLPGLLAETELQPEVGMATQPEQPEAQATAIVPKIELIGTVTGRSPSAILSIDDGRGGRTMTVPQGQEFEPGIRLVEVASSSVLLDANGETIEIGLRAANAVNYADKLNGVWKVHEKPETSALREPSYLEVRRIGGALEVKPVGREEVMQAEFQLVGRRLSVHIPEMQDVHLTGEISDDGDSISLEEVLDDEAIGQGEEPARLELTRVRQEDDSEAIERQLLANQCSEELREMYALLKSYADGHDGRFPSAIAALEPDYTSDLSIFESSNERRVEYFPDTKSPEYESLPPEPEYEPALSYADRLLAWEDALRASGAAELLWPNILLRLSYPAEDVTGTANVRGIIAVQTFSGTMPLDEASSQQLVAQQRAQDQNNLKQLGLVIKMFENEHRGFTPPGWLSVYPEYLTDTQILTSPKDKPGTDSYEYFLPAVNLDAMVLEMVEDQDDPAAIAKAQSEIPIVMNKTDWPDGGRNMLFADGHVQYERNWRERLLPR